MSETASQLIGDSDTSAGSAAAPYLQSTTRINYRRGLLGLLFGALCVSFSPIFVRLSEIGPNPLAFWRIALTLPLFMLGNIAHKAPSLQRQQPMTNGSFLLILTCGVLFAAAVVAGHWSIHYTSVANSMFFANMSPVFVVLTSVVILKKRFSAIFVLGMIIAISGVVLLMGNNMRIGPNTVLGDILGLVVAVTYGCYLMLVERLRHQFSTLKIMLWSSVVTTALLIPMAIHNGSLVFPTTTAGWLVVLGIAIVTQALGRTLVVYALAALPATYSSVTLLLQPLLATVLAALILSERISAWQIVGGTVVVFGICLVQSQRHRTVQRA